MTVIGMIGASTIGVNALIAPARHLGIEIAAVASPRPGAAADYARQHGISTSYSSYDRLLADDRIDAVYISTAASDHVRSAAAALGAGKHVLCEKPIAVDAAGALSLHGAAADSGAVLMEGFHYRFHALFQALLALANRGELGSLQSIESRVCGVREFVPGSILHEQHLGGGALLHNGVYAIHWSRMLFDAEPVTVDASQTVNPSGADSETRARLTFPGGRVASLICSFDRDAPVGATLTFEGGVVDVVGLIAPQYGHSLSIHARGKVRRAKTFTGEPTFDLQMQEFLRRIASGDGGTGRGDDIVANMSVVDLIRRSARATPA